MRERPSSDRPRLQIEVVRDPPLPMWPTWAYVGDLFAFYAVMAATFSVLGTIVMVLWARPMWGVWFVLGVAVTIVARRLLRSGLFHSFVHRLFPWQHVG